jgi:predicted N-formylglutamate amidohydrolase
MRRNLGRAQAFFLPRRVAGRKKEADAREGRVERSLDTLIQEDLGDKPYRSIEGDLRTGILILCDHAENTIPEPFANLGLRSEDLNRHIAYDLGAAPVAERLAKLLSAPALLSRFSRLLIDPNRGLDDPTLIMQISDGLVVPGNAGLDEAAIAARVARYYTPYHQAIERAIDAGIAAGKPPVVVSVHSFTQAWKGVPRPWSVGVLWDKDPRLALPLLEGLRTIPGIVVGDNAPYTGQLKGDTLYRHGTRRGLAHALIEVRQDLILGPEGQAEWATRLAEVLRKVVRLGGPLHAIEIHGSYTDIASAQGRNGEDAATGGMTEATRTELEAEAFRRLVAHLRGRHDVQNIELMELAGFCRNCLSNWYQEAAAAKGVALSKEEAREIVYGMPYETWKARYQTEIATKRRKRTG